MKKKLLTQDKIARVHQGRKSHIDTFNSTLVSVAYGRFRFSWFLEEALTPKTPATPPQGILGPPTGRLAKERGFKTFQLFQKQMMQRFSIQ